MSLLSLKDARDDYIPELVKNLEHIRALVEQALSHWEDGLLEVDECFNILNHLDSIGRCVRDICRGVQIGTPPCPFGGIVLPHCTLALQRPLGMVCEGNIGCFHVDPDAEYVALDQVINCIDCMLWQCQDLPKSCVPCRVKHAKKVAARLGRTYTEACMRMAVIASVYQYTDIGGQRTLAMHRQFVTEDSDE